MKTFLGKYHLFTGSAEGGEDVYGYHSVGMSNHTTITGLSFLNGRQFFASVKGKAIYLNNKHHQMFGLIVQSV